MDYIVKVRFANEEHRVTEFVTPWHHQIQKLAQDLGHDVQSCYDWVCRNVNYPYASDRHHMSAFWGPIPILTPPLISITATEFWQFPYETLGWRKKGKAIEDCDGSSLLLCSMLRCFVPEDRVYVGIGGYSGIDHAWVRYYDNGVWWVLESTLDDPFPMYSLMELEPYNLYCYFNDRDAVELVPGSFDFLSSRRKNYRATVGSLCRLREMALTVS